MLKTLEEALGELLNAMDALPQTVKETSLVDPMKNTLGELEKIAGEEGYEGLVPKGTLRPTAVKDIKNSVAEVKALMEQVRLLMDKKVNKPVVKGWMEWK